MDTKHILQSDILDILFEKRNKTYGAYELRRNYHKRARKAAIAVIVFVSIVISAPLVAGLVRAKDPVLLPPPQPPYVLRTVKTSNPVLPPAIKTHPKPTQHKPIKQTPTVVEAAPLVTQPVVPITPTTPAAPAGPSGPVVDVNPSVSTTGGGNSTNTGVLKKEDPDMTYTSEMELDSYPEFPGGEEALINYLSRHITYPPQAISREVEGRVILGFVINKEGGIDEMNVVSGVGFGLDEEALRVVGAMPKWKPGKNNGKPVRVYLNLPIKFELDSK